MTVKYCNWEGWPTIVGDTEAWSLVNGAWKKVDHADAFTKAHVIGKAAFDTKFGQLPDLPQS